MLDETRDYPNQWTYPFYILLLAIDSYRSYLFIFYIIPEIGFISNITELDDGQFTENPYV